MAAERPALAGQTPALRKSRRRSGAKDKSMPTVIASHRAVGAVHLECCDQCTRRSLALIAIVIGVAVRLWQYTANPSLWVDEAAIARNVLDRHPWQLFGSLDYGQIAPPGFLLSVKFSVTWLGFSEYALRLVPFVAGIISPALFSIIARSVLRPVGTLIATLLFSIAVPLVFFSSNLKQYSSDVALTLLVIGIALRLRGSLLTLRRVCGFAFVAVPLLFCSHAAVFPLTVAGVVVFTDAFVAHRGDRWYRLAVVAASTHFTLRRRIARSVEQRCSCMTCRMLRSWQQPLRTASRCSIPLPPRCGLAAVFLLLSPYSVQP